ncbi:hypothetical protein BH23VER1_BH23VER1_36060 [soil metagenome]
MNSCSLTHASDELAHPQNSASATGATGTTGTPFSRSPPAAHGGFSPVRAQHGFRKPDAGVGVSSHP